MSGTGSAAGHGAAEHGAAGHGAAGHGAAAPAEPVLVPEPAAEPAEPVNPDGLRSGRAPAVAEPVKPDNRLSGRATAVTAPLVARPGELAPHKPAGPAGAVMPPSANQPNAPADNPEIAETLPAR